MLVYIQGIMCYSWRMSLWTTWSHIFHQVHHNPSGLFSSQQLFLHDTQVLLLSPILTMVWISAFGHQVSINITSTTSEGDAFIANGRMKILRSPSYYHRLCQTPSQVQSNKKSSHPHIPRLMIRHISLIKYAKGILDLLKNLIQPQNKWEAHNSYPN
jgi:hypothetical protein